MEGNRVNLNTAATVLIYEKRFLLSLISLIDDHRADDLYEEKLNWHLRRRTDHQNHLLEPKKQATNSLPQKAVEKNMDVQPNLGEAIWFDEEVSMRLCSQSSSTLVKENRIFSASFSIYSNELLVSWFMMLADCYLSFAKSFSSSEISEICQTLEESSFEKTPLAAEKSEQNDYITGHETAVVSSVDLSSENFPGNSSTSLSPRYDSSSSPIPNSERVSYLVSLLNLDGEDCKWFSDSDMDGLKDFPSPSYKSNCRPQDVSSGSISSPLNISHDKRLDYYILSSKMNRSETTDLEDVKAEEPIFWPFEKKFNWSPEDSSSCFPMSPRKNIHFLEMPQSSTTAKFRDRKMESEKGIRRRLVLGSGSPTPKAVRNSKMTQSSRLSNSSKKTEKTLDVRNGHNGVEFRDKLVTAMKPYSTEKNLLDTDFMSNSILLEEDLVSSEGLPIETLLGLKEFKGHEGVESEFDADVFSFGDSL